MEGRGWRRKEGVEKIDREQEDRTQKVSQGEGTGIMAKDGEGDTPLIQISLKEGQEEMTKETSIMMIDRGGKKLENQKERTSEDEGITPNNNEIIYF